MSSSGSSDVVKCVTKKSSAAISRRPPADRRRPSHRARRGRVAARLRRRRGRASRTRCRGCGSRGGRRRAAPAAAADGRASSARTPPAEPCAPTAARRSRHRSLDPGNTVDVDEHRRTGQPHVQRGTRLCPPASTFASSPCSASSGDAPPSTTRAARIANGAGFTRPPASSSHTRGRRERQLDVVDGRARPPRRSRSPRARSSCSPRRDPSRRAA